MELAGSRRDCEEQLGSPCTSVAYPFGAVDDRVAAAADRAGYRAGAALPEAPHAARPLAWPRVGIYASDSFGRFRAKTSRLRRLRARRMG